LREKEEGEEEGRGEAEVKKTEEWKKGGRTLK
jgi:hypothetical protein